MNLSPQEAASALQHIAQAQRRLGVFAGYRHAAPHLGLWGLVWMVGYGITDLAPRHAGWAWLALNLCGAVAAFLIAQRQGRAAGEPAPGARLLHFPLRLLATGLALAGFIVATFWLMRPASLAQFAAFPALLMGFVYAAAGLWGGLRWTLIGAALIAATLLGYQWIHAHYLLWLAAACGGTLMLSAWWLKAR